MSAPRLEVDLDKIYHNACTLAKRLEHCGIAITGVVKATLGSAQIARVILKAGIQSLGDSRIENIEALRQAGINTSMTLIRSPMLSQVERVVRSADISLNTDLLVMRKLSEAAVKLERVHGIILMVELGDLREGIMPADLHSMVKETRRLPNIVLRGIGGNLACRSGVIPGDDNMAVLCALADSIDKNAEDQPDKKPFMVSAGNSANLHWALTCADPGRINNLRIGESILLGCDPLHRKPIDDLYTDAIVLVAEVIECKKKPSLPWGDFAQNAFGENVCHLNRGPVMQAILAIGQQDIDPDGLNPPPGVAIRGCSSDHLIVETDGLPIETGAELSFTLSYGALLRAMTSPFVSTVMSTSAHHVESLQSDCG